MFCKTDWAETVDTSCSLEHPPKTTNTFFTVYTSKNKFINNKVYLNIIDVSAQLKNVNDKLQEAVIESAKSDEKNE